MGFERFDKSLASAVNKPAEVSVLPSGVISLTWRAFEMINCPDQVEFFFDREERVVGIAASSDATNAYQVRRPRVAGKDQSNARGTVTIRGAALFTYYDIDLSEKFTAEPFLRDDLLCFALPGHTPKTLAESAGSSATSEEPPF